MHYNLSDIPHIIKQRTILNINSRSKHFIGIFHTIYIPNNPRRDLRSKVISFHYRPNLAASLLRVLASTTLRQQNIHASRDLTSNFSPLNNQGLVRLSHPCKYSTETNRSNKQRKKINIVFTIRNVHYNELALLTLGHFSTIETQLTQRNATNHFIPVKHSTTKDKMIHCVAL